MRVRCYFDVTTDADLELSTNDALRQFPIASLTDVLTVQINGETLSDNVADKIHAMLCFGNDAQSRHDVVSMSPSMPDMYQRYADWGTYGSAKNPLGGYGENGVEDPRGGFPVQVIGPRQFRVVVTEPLFLSPFLTGFEAQDEGFVNVNQFNISIRWKSQLSQILSHSSLGNAITSVTVSFYQAPDLLTTYITPDLVEPIPQLQVLPYVKPQEYIKSVELLAPGASTRVISDSIRLSQIPKKMYLFCRHKRSVVNQNYSDSFLGIDRLSVLFNNQSGLFASASEQDLYSISKSNGLNLSYPQWRKYRGGVFCAEFGKNIGLLDNESPGCQGIYTVQVQMDVTNVSDSAFDGEFFVVMLNEGTFSISEQFARASLGNLSPQAVLMAKESPEIAHVHYDSLQGGGFFSGLKNIINKIATGVSDVAGVASHILPVIPGLGPEAAALAGTVGSIAKGVKGATGGEISGGMISGGGRRARRLSRR